MKLGGELFLPSLPARKMTYLHLPLLLLLALLPHCYSLSGKGVGERQGERLTEEYLLFVQSLVLVNYLLNLSAEKAV
jgi:hypothetical protein